MSWAFFSRRLGTGESPKDGTKALWMPWQKMVRFDIELIFIYTAYTYLYIYICICIYTGSYECIVNILK